MRFAVMTFALGFGGCVTNQISIEEYCARQDKRHPGSYDQCANYYYQKQQIEAEYYAGMINNFSRNINAGLAPPPQPLRCTSRKIAYDVVTECQ